MNNPIEKAARLIHESTVLIICTGAGMGVDSGIATFRGQFAPDAGYGPYNNDGPYQMSKYRLACDNPRYFWGYFQQRYHQYKQATPHLGYEIITTRLAKKNKKAVGWYTSNIDGHAEHFAATCCLVEIHGSMNYMQCHRNCKSVWPVDIPRDMSFELDEKEWKTKGLPKCIHCEASWGRSNVCLIGDAAFCETRKKEQLEKFNAQVLDMIDTNMDRVVVLEIGAGTGIPTVRRFSGEMTHEYNASLIRINYNEPELDRAVDCVNLEEPDKHVSIGGISAKECLISIASALPL
jgi:NAD-dependent SIR2 family protein deacetylase